MPAIVETAAPGVKCPPEIADLVPTWMSVLAMVLGCVPLVLAGAYYTSKSVSASTVVDWWIGGMVLTALLGLVWFLGTDAHKVYRMRAAACGN